MKKIFHILYLISSMAYGQSNNARTDCPCTTLSTISDWKPDLSAAFDIKNSANNFARSINGMYIAEDRDSLYQIKIIIDSKAYGTFVHFQHLNFSKAKLLNKQTTTCDQLPNVHDGGWIGTNIFPPSKAINKRFVASTFFLGESNFKINKTKSYRLYKCDKKTEFGLIDINKQRYYRKVHWQPEGSFPEISLIGFLQNDVKKYSKQQLAAMRNAVYARYNYAFKEDGKWYAQFDKKPSYRWNHFKDVSPFITTLEKDNIEYITAFESPDFYDNQHHNDFLDFWQKLRTTVQENNMEKLASMVQFPFNVSGDLDDIPILKVNRQQFASIWPMLLLQENYDINNANKLISWLSKSVFSDTNAFAEQMIHTKTNSIANLNFEKINGVWKINNAYADSDLYPKIQKLLATEKSKLPTNKN